MLGLLDVRELKLSISFRSSIFSIIWLLHPNIVKISKNWSKPHFFILAGKISDVVILCHRWSYCCMFNKPDISNLISVLNKFFPFIAIVYLTMIAKLMSKFRFTMKTGYFKLLQKSELWLSTLLSRQTSEMQTIDESFNKYLLF